MTYPEFEARLRTDADFIAQLDEDHHLLNLLSPLAELNIGLVTQVVLDYMHLVCLGAMRRLIMLWLKGDLRYRLPARVVNEISARLVSLRNTMPREFSRKPRSLNEFKQWKATELRQFLLYSGLCMLRDIIPVKIYDNFVTLSVAITCLLRPDIVKQAQYVDYAENLLINFVKNFEVIYGAEQLVYNMHTLIHPAQDCRQFGPLDTISAFPFENYLDILKRLVRRPQNLIAQIVHRLSEKENRPTGNCADHSLLTKDPHIREHYAGPLPQNLPAGHYQQYLQYKSGRRFVSVLQGNNCFEINSKFALVRTILGSSSNETIIVYETFSTFQSFYSVPLDSKELDTFIVTQLSGVLQCCNLSQLGRKFVSMPYKDSFIIVPLLHEELEKH